MKHEDDHVYTSFIGRHRWLLSVIAAVVIITIAARMWQ